MTKEITYINTNKTGLDRLVKLWILIKTTEVNVKPLKIIILIKQGIYTMHAVIPTKYQKYPSTTILKHMNVLAKVKKIALCEFNQYDIPWHLQYYNPRTYNDHKEMAIVNLVKIYVLLSNHS